MKLLSIMTCALLMSPLAWGASKRAKASLGKAPVAVQKTVEKHSRGSKIDDFDKITVDGKTIYVAEFDRKDDLKIYVSKKGSLIKTREEIRVKDTPEVVLAAVRKYEGKIDEVKKETAGKSVVYRIEIDRKGQPDLKLIVSADGKILSEKKD